MFSNSGSPVPILKITPEKVTIDVPVLKEILQKVGDFPFALYSINGLKRTGKSFLLSQYIRYLKHSKDPSSNSWLTRTFNEKPFEWRRGDKRQTIGIDLWSEPIWIQKDNRKVALLLMDTQGSFDEESSVQLNTIVFAISTLLSSVLIYNVMRDIDEGMLQFFTAFCSYATMTVPIDKKIKTGEGFQNFIFLIRDYASPQDYKYGFYDNNTVPPGQQQNYKKEKVNSKSSQPDDVRFTHDLVTSSFQDVGVYLMPEPDKGLKYRDNCDNMDEEFAEHLEAFVKLLKSQKMVLKKIGGVEVTGTEMINYVTSWARLFDGSDLPEIKSIYNSAADAQYLLAKYMAVMYYTNGMQKCLQEYPDGLPENQFLEKSEEFCIASKKIFQSRRRLGGKEYDDKFEQEFTAETEQHFQTFKTANHANLKADRIRKENEEQNRKMMEEIENVKADQERQKQNMLKDIENQKRIAIELEEKVKAVTLKNFLRANRHNRSVVQPKPIHHGISCDKCNDMCIAGVRYQCAGCENYDLCEDCEPLYREMHPECHFNVITTASYH